MSKSLLKQNDQGNYIVEVSYSKPLVSVRNGFNDGEIRVEISAPSFEALEIGYKELGETIAQLKASQEAAA